MAALRTCRLRGVIISLCPALSDLDTPVRLAPSPDFQSKIPSLILCFQLSISLHSEMTGHRCALWDALGVVQWVLLGKEMLPSQHRAIVATFRRAPSDLFFSRAKLRSERSENGKESVASGLWQRIARTDTRPTLPVEQQGHVPGIWQLWIRGSVSPVQTLTLEPEVKLSI